METLFMVIEFFEKITKISGAMLVFSFLGFVILDIVLNFPANIKHYVVIGIRTLFITMVVSWVLFLSISYAL